jgi:hypothetical protein
MGHMVVDVVREVLLFFTAQRATWLDEKNVYKAVHDLSTTVKI